VLELIFWVAVAALALFAARQFEAHERRRDGDVIVTPPPKRPENSPSVAVPPSLPVLPEAAAEAAPTVTTAPPSMIDEPNQS
jgi:hypothetical protein